MKEWRSLHIVPAEHAASVHCLSCDKSADYRVLFEAGRSLDLCLFCLRQLRRLINEDHLGVTLKNQDAAYRRGYCRVCHVRHIGGMQCDGEP